MANQSKVYGGPTVMSDKDYQAQSDHRTLSDAADIQSDKGRMAGVKLHQVRQQKKLNVMQKTMLGGSNRQARGRR